MADTISTKSKILKQSSDCFKNSRTQVCKELVSEIEKLQLIVLVLINDLIKLICNLKKKDALNEHLSIKGRNRLKRLPLNSILKKFTC